MQHELSARTFQTPETCRPAKLGAVNYTNVRSRLIPPRPKKIRRGRNISRGERLSGLNLGRISFSLPAIRIIYTPIECSVRSGYFLFRRADARNRPSNFRRVINLARRRA